MTIVHMVITVLIVLSARLSPEGLLNMRRGMTLSEGERYEGFHSPLVNRLT